MPGTIDDYRQLTEQPWGKMFYEIIYKQLNLSIDTRLNILDYGAGFCITANHYAKFHNVTAIEPSSDMIDLRVGENDFVLINDNIEAVKDISDKHFDLVICHNVLEYAADKKKILTELTRVLKPGGKLSIIKHNLTGRILAYAVFGDNPESALELLNRNSDNENNMFGKRDTYDNRFLLEFADDFCLTCENIFGIRTFFALSSNSKIKYTDEWYKNMFELEMKVCNMDEYKNIAFFNHFIFTKDAG